MFNYLPSEYKKIQADCDKLFEFYGGCDNCNHQLCCRIASPVMLWGEIIPIAKKSKIIFNFLINLSRKNINCIKKHRYT